jgi:hypothetical protein
MKMKRDPFAKSKLKFAIWVVLMVIGIALFVTGFALPTYIRDSCEYLNCTCTNSSVGPENCVELIVCFSPDNVSPKTELCSSFYPQQISPTFGCPPDGFCWYATWPSNSYPLYTTAAPENYRAPIVIAGTSVILLVLYVWTTGI